MAVVVAPAIGPTLGGWITDNFNWHWIFFINLPVGMLSLFFTSRLVEDPPWLKEERRGGIKIDYIGLSLLVIGIACFQFVLDKGQEADWFASPLITALACVGVPTLVAFFLWEWYHPQPHRRRAPAQESQLRHGRLILLCPGNGVVRFHGVDTRVSAEQPGLHGRTGRPGALARGFVLMLMMLVAGRLTATKIDPRLLICIGFLGTSFALRLMTNIYLQIDFTTIVLLRMIQVFSCR